MMLTPPASLNKARPQAVHQNLVEQAIKYAVASGDSQENANKLRGVFLGPEAPFRLRFQRLYIVDINPVLEKHIATAIDPISGHYVWRTNPECRIDLRELGPEEPARVYFVAFERLGNIGADGSPPSKFWTGGVVVLDTVGPNTPALTLPVDITNDGNAIKVSFPDDQYTIRRRDPVTNLVVTLDKRATLTGLAGLGSMAATAMFYDGFPVLEVEKNRMSPSELAQARQKARQAAIQTGAPAGAANTPANAPVTTTLPTPDLAPRGGEGAANGSYNPFNTPAPAAA